MTYRDEDFATSFVSDEDEEEFDEEDLKEPTDDLEDEEVDDDEFEE